MLKTGRTWTNYNFREYILRRVHEDFALHRTEADPTRIQALISSAQQNLAIIKRQGIIQNMYNVDKLVLEFKKPL